MSDTKDAMYLRISIIEPEQFGMKVESNAPNYDIMINMLSQASRYLEDQRQEQVAQQRFQKMQDQELAARLTRQ